MQIIIDYNNMIYRNFFGAQRDITELGFQYWKHVMLQSIFYYIKKFEPDEVVIASDSKQNWRKKVFPEYKSNRKDNRDKQENIDWESLFNTSDELFKELKAFFPFYCLKVNYMEADDIIGVIAKNNQSEKKIVISSDTDFIQLLKYNNIDLFDPKNTIFLKSDDPQKDLKVKILAGDRGDNVPNIIKRSMTEKIKKRFGEETAKTYVDEPSRLKELFEDNTPYCIVDENKTQTQIFNEETGQKIPLTIGKQAKLGYKRNTILIDLQYTPKELIDILNQTIANYVLPDGKQIFQYFSENQFREFVSKIEQLEPYIKKLVDNYKQQEILKG